jgi:small subunit ribosomal protein S15
MSKYLYKELKEQIFEKYSRNGNKEDTGSPEAQIALFSYRINSLTEHLKKNRKDKSTQLGLQRLVGKRRRLLDYLKKKDIERYRAVLKELNLRR